MASHKLRIALFDVDGTLVAPGDALSARALQAALCHGYGLPKIDLSLLRRQGLTSREAIIGLAVRHGVSGPEAAGGLEDVLRLRDIHYGALVAADAGEHPLAASPHAREFVSALVAARVHLGLVTGNSEFAARTKLARAGFDSTAFAVGAFGDSVAGREELAATVLDCMRAYLSFEIDEVLLVGDAPVDIRAGLAVGCRTLAVASGSYGAKELSECGPDLLVDDLEPTTQLMRYVLGGSRRT
jgi:phosphoglycolate phosphatase